MSDPMGFSFTGAFYGERETMSKKRYRPEEIISKLREADSLISQGETVVCE
jgi:hypothetical protein